jgi:EamA domain-containing membrane protein RarD
VQHSPSGLVFSGVNTSLGGTQATYYVWAIQEKEFDSTAALFHAPLTNLVLGAVLEQLEPGPHPVRIEVVLVQCMRYHHSES